jgi:predicted alpha/beta-hydrolase family hydrolase
MSLPAELDLSGQSLLVKAQFMSQDPELLFDGPSDASLTVALAHGAGAAMDTPFMSFFAQGLARQGYLVARFEFPYMAARRQGGRGGPPDRESVLRQTWLRVVKMLEAKHLVIGGKSMGGRIASMIADEAGAAGLVCLGYPFHPVGKPGRTRTEHLRTLKTPTLVLQGERDPFGNREDVAGYELSPAIRVEWLLDGDHSLKPRKSSGRTEAENWTKALNAMANFIGALPRAA